MYWQLPYLAHHSAASIGRLIQGDVTLGLKVGLSGQKGWKPATAFSLQVIAPSDTSSRMLGRGSSDGVVDFGLHCAATWSLNNRASVSANLGLIRLADLADADRVIDSTGTHVMPNERPSLLRLAAGIRFKVYKESSLVVEAFQLSPVGGHTPVFNESGATDAIIGLEIPFRRLAITAAYRLHLRPQPNDRMLTTGPLAGAVDLSDVEPGARAKYLQSVGAPVVGDLNDNVVVVGAPQGDLPAGARSIPANFTTSTTGNGGTVFSISYRF